MLPKIVALQPQGTFHPPALRPLLPLKKRLYTPKTPFALVFRPVRSNYYFPRSFVKPCLTIKAQKSTGSYYQWTSFFLAYFFQSNCRAEQKPPQPSGEPTVPSAPFLTADFIFSQYIHSQLYCQYSSSLFLPFSALFCSFLQKIEK